MSLKEILSGETALKTGRGILIPRLNRFLLQRGTIAKPRYAFWLQDFRPEPSRDDLRFHPSSTGRDFCPREWVIKQHRLGEPDGDDRRVDAKGQRIFEMGDAVHAMIQHWFAEMGALYGRWECSKHPDTHSMWGTSLVRCPQCKGRLIYCEVPVDHAVSGILGHCDGEVIFDGVVYGIEIKSCHSRVFESVKKYPMENHRHQAAQYLWVRSQTDGWMTHLGEKEHAHAIPKSAVILYFNKDTAEMREHVIELDDDLLRRVINPKMKSYAQAKAFRPGKLKTLPVRVCETPADGAMRKCSFVEACFDLPPKFVSLKRRKNAK